MARLVKCRGCGNKVSRNAVCCPNCGEPQKKKTSLVSKLFTIFIVFPTLAAAIIMSQSGNYGSSYDKPVITKKKSYPIHATYDVSKLTDAKLLAWAEKAKREVKSRLKDSNSARFGKVYVHQKQKDVWMVCGYINAKNSLGAYICQQQFVSGASNDTTFLASDVTSGWSAIWNKNCASKS